MVSGNRCVVSIIIYCAFINKVNMDIGTGIAIASAVVPVVAILNRLLPPNSTGKKCFSYDLCKEKHNNIDEQVEEIKKDIDRIEESIRKLCRCTR